MKEPDANTANKIQDVANELIMHLKDSGLDPHEAMASIAMGMVQLALAMEVNKDRLLMGIDISYDVLSGKADVPTEEDETWH